MRNTFIAEVENNIQRHSNVYFLTGDLGFGVLDKLKNVLKNRFINVGVAEQLMTGMAAGLALTKKKVYTYSIANFSTLRCIEQIRNDVCYHNLDVKIISVGAGLAYGTHGYTHFGIEDIAALKAFKNLEIICPLDPIEARAAAQYSLATTGPLYIRLGKNGESVIHTNYLDFNKQRFFSFFEEDVENVFLATGSIGQEALKAVKSLRGEGISIDFISVPFITNLDIKMLKGKKLKRIFTIEEHVLCGGFGSSVLELLNDNNMSVYVKRFGVPSDLNKIGSQSYLLKDSGLDFEHLVKEIKRILSDI